MKYIFIDESGDLGFKKASSRWFLFAAIITHDEKILVRIVKKVWKSLKKKFKTRGELHAYHDNDYVRKKLLKTLSKTNDIEIVFILMDKSKISKHHPSYEDISEILINKIYLISNFRQNEKFQFTFDKRDPNKINQESFIKRLSDFNNVKNDKTIKLHSSHEDKSIQAVDFVAWAAFRKYEKGDSTFYDLINNKVVCEYILPINKNAPPL